MLKTFRSSRIPLLLVLILTLVVSLQAVRSAEAYSYVCGTTLRTTTGSGTGLNCDGAVAAARTNAEGKANAACQYGVCSFYLSAVNCSGSSATVTAKYKCYTCVNGPCPF